MTDFNQPLGGNDMARFAGPATMMRLPSQPTAEGLDVGFVVVPLDIGTSNRSGTRHGPRQIRAESCMLRPFNLATEGLLTCDKVFQIGLRGSGYSPEDFSWSRQQGFTVVQAEECWYQSMKPLLEHVRATIGDHPVYLTDDIDSLDPAFAPGTGTVEVGGLSTWQALEIIRGYRGLNLIGGDLVEVSPPYDPSGNTALIAANFLYEMLCVLPGVSYGG